MQPKKTLKFKSHVQIIKGSKHYKELSGAGVSIMYKNFDRNIHDEILVYDGKGLVSQLGGVISLFLGISFYTLISNMLSWMEMKL